MISCTSFSESPSFSSAFPASSNKRRKPHECHCTLNGGNSSRLRPERHFTTHDCQFHIAVLVNRNQVGSLPFFNRSALVIDSKYTRWIRRRHSSDVHIRN